MPLLQPRPKCFPVARAVPMGPGGGGGGGGGSGGGGGGGGGSGAANPAAFDTAAGAVAFPLRQLSAAWRASLMEKTPGLGPIASVARLGLAVCSIATPGGAPSLDSTSRGNKIRAQIDHERS